MSRMECLKFEWDENKNTINKNTINKKKHDITFEEAKTVYKRYIPFIIFIYST